MEFTFDAYIRLINISIKNGYEICSYRDIDNHDKAIILRHDIDFSPSKALEMAKIEHKIGVKSTYFVLLSTEFYNVFSKETAEIFSQIADMGHELGLHFDEQKYESCSIEYKRNQVYIEAEILSKALKTTIDVVSMHRPSKFILENNLVFKDIINSYSKKYFEDIKYVSDSRMNWKENVLDLLFSSANNKIHILTHPFWYSGRIEKIQDKLFKFINEASTDRYKLMNENFRNLQEYIKIEEVK